MGVMSELGDVLSLRRTNEKPTIEEEQKEEEEEMEECNDENNNSIETTTILQTSDYSPHTQTDNRRPTLRPRRAANLRRRNNNKQ
jgi:hypothetical protein